MNDSSRMVSSHYLYTSQSSQPSTGPAIKFSHAVRGCVFHCFKTLRLLQLQARPPSLHSLAYSTLSSFALAHTSMSSFRPAFACSMYRRMCFRFRLSASISTMLMKV